MTDDTLPFERDAVRCSIDERIEHWRDSDYEHAEGAVHALQNLRVSLFGEMNSCAECGRTDPHGHSADEP